MNFLMYFAIAWIAPWVMVVPAAPHGYVNDEAEVISSAGEAALNRYLSDYERQSGHQIFVVTLSTLDGQEIADVSYQIAQTWKIGQKGKDDGILLVVAPHERRARIEVGKGLEGLMTDLQSQRIQRTTMVPQFKRGNFEQGIRACVQGLVATLSQDPQQVKLQEAQYQPLDFWGWVKLIIFLLVIVGGGGFLWLTGLLSGGRYMGRSSGGRGIGGGWGGGFGGGGGGSFGGGGSSSDW